MEDEHEFWDNDDLEEAIKVINALRYPEKQFVLCNRKGHYLYSCDIMMNHVLASYQAAKNPKLRENILQKYKHFVRQKPVVNKPFPKTFNKMNMKQQKKTLHAILQVYDNDANDDDTTEEATDENINESTDSPGTMDSEQLNLSCLSLKMDNDIEEEMILCSLANESSDKDTLAIHLDASPLPPIVHLGQNEVHTTHDLRILSLSTDTIFCQVHDIGTVKEDIHALTTPITDVCIPMGTS